MEKTNEILSKDYKKKIKKISRRVFKPMIQGLPLHLLNEGWSNKIKLANIEAELEAGWKIHLVLWINNKERIFFFLPLYKAQELLDIRYWMVLQFMSIYGRDSRQTFWTDKDCSNKESILLGVGFTE